MTTSLSGTLVMIMILMVIAVIVVAVVMILSMTRRSFLSWLRSALPAPGAALKSRKSSLQGRGALCHSATTGETSASAAGL